MKITGLKIFISKFKMNKEKLKQNNFFKVSNFASRHVLA